MKSGREIAVLGNGGFGTALACTCAQQGHAVRLWGHDPDYTREIAAARENPRYLPGIEIPRDIRIGSDPSLLEGGEIVLSLVPTQHVRSVLAAVGKAIPDGVPIVSGSKGMEQATGQLPTEVIQGVLPRHPTFVLTGPCHAEELARGKPTTVVLAGEEGEVLERLQDDLAGPTFRIYRIHDARGAELAAAVKNVIAIAAGMGDGLDLGDNAKAALLTRGIAEMARFGVACGAQRETFYGLAGIGDLITTAVSPHGRNRALGERLGRGEALEQILAGTRKVAEGVWTCRAVLQRSRALAVEMPITEEVEAILFEHKEPAAAVRDLMTRMLKAEQM